MKNLPKGFNLLLLIVIVVVLLLCGCMYYSQNKNQSGSQTKFIDYKNNEYGFSIDYPSFLWAQFTIDKPIGVSHGGSITALSSAPIRKPVLRITAIEPGPNGYLISNAVNPESVSVDGTMGIIWGHQWSDGYAVHLVSGESTSRDGRKYKLWVMIAPVDYTDIADYISLLKDVARTIKFN